MNEIRVISEINISYIWKLMCVTHTMRGRYVV